MACKTQQWFIAAASKTYSHASTKFILVERWAPHALTKNCMVSRNETFSQAQRQNRGTANIVCLNSSSFMRQLYVCVETLGGKIHHGKRFQFKQTCQPCSNSQFVVGTISKHRLGPSAVPQTFHSYGNEVKGLVFIHSILSLQETFSPPFKRTSVKGDGRIGGVNTLLLWLLAVKALMGAMLTTWPVLPFLVVNVATNHSQQQNLTLTCLLASAIPGFHESSN